MFCTNGRFHRYRSGALPLDEGSRQRDRGQRGLAQARDQFGDILQMEGEVRGLDVSELVRVHLAAVRI